MAFELTQLAVNVTVTIALAMVVAIMFVMRCKFTIKYDNTVRLRHHKLSGVSCGSYQELEGLCLVNDMGECGYGLSLKRNSGCSKDIEDYGIMTAEFDKDAPAYNARKLSQYCKSKGITPDELTDEELNSLQTK